MSPLVSVIIPVYNASKYLHQCLDSILSQTLTDIEVICIDDGSTDNSLEILKKYGERDNRIKILNQDNGGGGAARNKGLYLSTGKYLSFLDSDDLFDSKMLESAYNLAESENADVTVFQYRNYYEEKNVISKIQSGIHADYLNKSKENVLSGVTENIFSLTNPAPWNKLFRRSYIINNNIQFQEIRRSNDVYFCFVSLYCADRIAILKSPHLYYRITSSTYSKESIYKNPLDTYHAFLEVKKRLCNTPKWNLVDKCFANVALTSCISHLYLLKKGHRTAYCQLLDELINDGFNLLGISKYQKKDYSNKYIYWLYQQIISEYYIDHPSNIRILINSISRYVYYLIAEISKLISLTKTVGLYQTVKYTYIIVNERLKTRTE